MIWLNPFLAQYVLELSSIDRNLSPVLAHFVVYIRKCNYERVHRGENTSIYTDLVHCVILQRYYGY